MSETKQLAGLVIITLIIGVIGLVLVTITPPLFEGNLVIDTYKTTVYENGTLQEQYIYDVKISGAYRMLFRSWEAPLSTSPANVPYIQFISMDPAPQTIGYFKDYHGMTTVVGEIKDVSSVHTINDLAETNEVGIFKPGYFTAGKYTVGYTYILHPPIEYDTRNTHLNLKLAGSAHIPYRQIQIIIPATYVRQIYTYPPTITAREVGDTYIITGSAAADENIGVELLMTPDAFKEMPGFRISVDDLKGKIESGSFWYNLPYTIAFLLNYLAKVAVLLVPALFIVIYYQFGKEKLFTVPAYLSTIPNPRLKPWEVNLLFKDDALDFDEDGYYATLLDLHRRKIISITQKVEGKGVVIKILKDASDDPYEKRVLVFITQLSQNGILDTDAIEALAKEANKNRSAEEKALKYQKMLIDVTRRAGAVISTQYIVNGRDHIIPFLLSGIALFAITLILALVEPMQLHILFPAVVLWGFVIVQCIIAIAAPSTLFGHWKDDRFKEKLEWDSFAHFLSDLAMMRKYSPADLSMWGEWLVYGTTLGVGDSVERAMKEFNISIPETGVPIGVIGMNQAFVPLLYFTPPSHGGFFRWFWWWRVWGWRGFWRRWCRWEMTAHVMTLNKFAFFQLQEFFNAL